MPQASGRPSRTTGSATCTCTCSRTRGSTCCPTTPWCSPCCPSRRTGRSCARPGWSTRTPSRASTTTCATLTHVWSATNAQDSAFVARTQRGVAGPRLRAGAVLAGRGRRRRVRQLVHLPRSSAHLSTVNAPDRGAIGPSRPRYRGRMGSTEEQAKLNQSVRKAITLLRATAEDRNANVSSLAQGGRAAARDGAADDPDARAGGIPAAQSPATTACCWVRSCCASPGTPTSSCSCARCPARSSAIWSPPSGRP